MRYSGAMHQSSPSDRRLYADDLRVGADYPLGSYHVTREELLDYARHWDPQVFHVDEEAAEHGHFRGLITSGLHTMAIYQRLAVLDVFQHWHVIAGRTFREVQFLRPVRAGDDLTGTVRIESIVPGARERALVTTSAELVVAEGKPVLTLLVDAYVRLRRDACSG